MQQQDTGSTPVEPRGLEVKVEGPGSVKRRTSKEDKKVNFAEGVTSARELSKRDSQRELTAPRASLGEDGSPKSQRKFISTWKMACDKTKDRTKELLKRWRTMPEGAQDGDESRLPVHEVDSNSGDQGWSVHVWGVVEGENGSGDEATWVKRFPAGDESLDSEKKKELILTEVQKEKLSHLFAHCFDMDRDDIISLQDFESFTERLRHYADWSTNCGEYLILEQVQQGFVDTFILPIREESTENTLVDIDRLFLSLEEWLYLWSELLTDVKNMHELPIWLQFLPKVLFRAMDKSCDGIINKEELASFYSSVIGFPTQKVNEVIDLAFKSMTSNGDTKLTYNTFRLCFANFIFGRFPNGPGSYIFGHCPKQPPQFPIDYSAMNTPPGELELYSFDSKSNRSSIVV
ncbi:uncharacterized protein LOC106666188 isoform X1 [Cimex lectularius]|uniref:EF-hand domain-containing protein n=1 Tax=Cimex lectularius TaxID=79782 RepID=A0A8I6RNQ4_CIMLE|nr:uncharacterized protein LOC106666188 isoform X1 [Cimex lectularius]XP_014248680.1 uncharacterized protein LOC106666188 isoform X1 [Cimex lectularius]XP_014248681.1 uncharacterized protein LOC106666188 isoform X1 [Cimex lectularius]